MLEVQRHAGAMRACMVVGMAVAVLLGGCGRTTDNRNTHSDDANSKASVAEAQPDEHPIAFVGDSEEAIVEAIQKGTDFSGEPNLEWFLTLEDIWYERTASHPDFAWATLRGPRVKVVLGSQLAQAYRNRIIQLNGEDIRKFALANYANSDQRVARPSVLLLGELGNQNDVPLLKQLARDGAGGRRLYKEAVTALVHICGQQAERALTEVLPEGTEDDRKFAQEWLKNRDDLRRAWCD